MNFELVNNSSGYSIVKCLHLYTLAEQQVFATLQEKFNKKFNSWDDLYLARDEFFFHSALLAKKNRILSIDRAEAIKNEIGRLLSLRVNDFLITDEENIGYGNIYFRYVRADSPEDVGPIHADSWFWEMNGWEIPKNFVRIKIWIPILQDDSNPSFLVCDGSHERKYNYGINKSPKDGKYRPEFDIKKFGLTPIPAKIAKSEAIIFHDNLLHGGRSTKTDRISLECTVAVKL